MIGDMRGVRVKLFLEDGVECSVPDKLSVLDI